MTIDEAIKYARKVAERKKKAFQNCEDDCRFCLASKPCNEIAEEQEQIADWLEELKERRLSNFDYVQLMDKRYSEGYNKAIDEFAEALKETRADSCKEHNLKADIKKHREKMKYNGLSVGDTIKCANKEDLLNNHNDLAENGIQTDFMYEKGGVKGLWLEVMKIEK